MGFEKEETEKEYICRGCGTFYDSHELNGSECPKCETDENVYNNDLLIDE